MVGPGKVRIVAAFALVACLTVPIAEGSVKATVTGGERPWLIAFPLASDAPVQTYAAHRPVKVADAGPSKLVCVGADDRATICEQFIGEGEALRHYVLDEGRRVQGRYLVGRKGAAGASIRVRPAGVEARQPVVIPLARGAKEWVTGVRTDDAGWYEIEHLAPGSYIFEVTTRSGRVEQSDVIEILSLKPVPNRPPPSRTVVLPDFRFAEGVSVVVEVRSTDGLPIPAALVEVSQTSSGAAPHVVERTSDVEGVATLEGIDATVPGRVGCAAAGFTRFSEAFDTLPPLVTCTLARLATITGSVVDARGEPVPRAMIEVRGAHRSAATDTSGAFTIDSVPPGTYTIRASSSKSGMGNRLVTVTTGETFDLGEFRLGETRDVRGRVIAATTGEALAGASVTAIDPPGASAITDSDGTFALVCDAQGQTRVRVTADGYAPVESTFEAGATIRLPLPGSLDLLVWDDATGDPCAGCTMIATSSNGRVSGITSAEGRLRFELLAPGDYHVTRERVTTTSRGITVSGGADTQRTSVRANETTHLEIGSRLQLVKVTIDPAPPAVFAIRAHGSQRVVTATADASGQYSFRGRPGQAYDLTLVSERKGVFIGHIGSDYAGQMLSFHLGNREARLRVMQNEQPAADVLVRLANASGAPAAWAITDAGGFASIPYLRAGTYSVLVEGQRIGSVTPGEEPRTLILASLQR